MKTTKFFAIPFIALTLFTSCSDDDDATVIEEEEPITSLTLRFTNPSDNQDTVVLSWVDANEDEVIDAGERTVTGTFNTDAVYNAEIALMSKDEDFLEEDILANQASIDAHFFVYDTSFADITMVRADNDNAWSTGEKIGVNTVWTTGITTGTGTINIQLFHQSPGADDSDGFGSATGTETDIDITFNVEIQ